MSRAIAYRNLQAGWGILIDLIARHDIVRELPSSARPATERVWIDVAPANRLGEDERTPFGHPSVDFQGEGLTAAIVEWAAHELGFEPPHISSRLDKTQRRFIYDVPKA